MTDAEVVKVLAADLADVLRRVRRDTMYKVASDDYVIEDSDAAEMAREVCYELLLAANANGLCGCRLCQG